MHECGCLSRFSSFAASIAESYYVISSNDSSKSTGLMWTVQQVGVADRDSVGPSCLHFIAPCWVCGIMCGKTWAIKGDNACASAISLQHGGTASRSTAQTCRGGEGEHTLGWSLSAKSPEIRQHLHTLLSVCRSSFGSDVRDGGGIGGVPLFYFVPTSQPGKRPLAVLMETSLANVLLKPACLCLICL